MTRLRTLARQLRDERGQQGWTLIELLIVATLIMILAAVSLNMYQNSVWHAREAALRSNLFHMRDAIDQYYADKGNYPESLEALVSACSSSVVVDCVCCSASVASSILA